MLLTRTRMDLIEGFYTAMLRALTPMTGIKETSTPNGGRMFVVVIGRIKSVNVPTNKAKTVALTIM